MYVTGRVVLEHGAHSLDQGELPGGQGRLALVYLVLNRTRPIPRDELTDALWPDQAPPSADTALRAIVSKLRSGLTRAGLQGASVLGTDAGCYALRLPAGAVVDVEAAANSLDRAEGARRAGDLSAAWSRATVASAILRRPLLPGDDAPWLTIHRRHHRDLLLRAYDCITDVWLARGETTLAVATARAALDLAPYRESGHRRLMQAHSAAGDRGEALRVYEQCRVLLRDELGVNPSPETERVYADLLR